MGQVQITVTHIDTACMLLEINGFKILTDPTLDHAGGWYHHGFGAVSQKTDNPAIDQVDLNHIDLILLSHHQHKDNLDGKGKALALKVGRIVSTHAAARNLPGVTGLDDWESCLIETPKAPSLKITATPAQHHPGWLPAFFSGKVIGFLLEFDGQENGALYISGDTVFFSGIEEIARRFTIDQAFIHVGGVQFRYLSGLGRYTMNGKDLIKSVEVLNPRKVIPIHHRGWTHFKETETELRKVIKAHPSVSNRVMFVKSGIKTPL